MDTLTRTEVWNLAREVGKASDLLLEKHVGDPERLKFGLFSRLSAAEQWLDMMHDHVTADSRIVLSDSVVVACFDAHIDVSVAAAGK